MIFGQNARMEQILLNQDNLNESQIHFKIYLVQYEIFGNFHQNFRNFQNFDCAPIFHKILHMSC